MFRKGNKIMNKRKFLAMFLSAVMVANIGIPILADTIPFSVENNLDSESERASYDISVNPYNSNDVETKIELYKIMPQTAKAMREYSRKCISGEIKDGKLILTTEYKPNSRQKRSLIGYVGYKNKRYQEEKITTTQSSSWGKVDEGRNYSDYLEDTINATINFTVNFAADYVTGGAWSIASILPSALACGVPADTSFRHEARLHEAKTEIFTYIDMDGTGQYSLGSRVERVNYHFENSSVFPSLGKTKYGEDTSSKTKETPNFNNRDTKAYSGDLNGEWIEAVDDYEYGGTTFKSIR